MDWDALPTLGSVRERIGYFATVTGMGELNTTLNNAYNYIYDLEVAVRKAEADRDNNPMNQASRELFECLMNRIYNASDFVRLQAPSDRERKAIDTWLQLQEEKELSK
jgi:hypothetical protein